MSEHEKHLAKEEGSLGLPLLQKNCPDVEKNFQEAFDFNFLAAIFTTKLCNEKLIVGRDFNEAIQIHQSHTTYNFYYLMVEIFITKSQLYERASALKIQKNTFIEPGSIISVSPICMNDYSIRSTFKDIYSTNINDFWPGSLVVTNPNALQPNALTIMAKTERSSRLGTQSFFSPEVEKKNEENAEWPQRNF